MPAVEWPSRMLAATFGMPGPLSIASTSMPTTPLAASGAHQQSAARAVLDEVGRGLGDDERELAGDGVVESTGGARAPRLRAAPRATWLRLESDARSARVIASA